MRKLGLLTIAVLSTTLAAQTVIPLEPFRSVELHDGGHVIVRHGPVQRVTLLQGNLRSIQVRVAGGKRLVIENCKPDCARHERVKIDVVTPEVSAVSVSNGGILQIVGAFPVQGAIKASVEQGGTVDIRSIAAGAVDASVYSGGGILTNPRSTLTASVESGGAITYWGDVRVSRSVRDGGVVQRGTAADADKPLSEMIPSHPLPPLPPLPAVPPVPPLRHGKS